MSIIEQFLRIIAPHQCLGCGSEGRLLCSVCVLGLPAVSLRCYRCGCAGVTSLTCADCRRNSDLFAVTSVTVYDGLAKGLIHCLKFERSAAAAEDIAEAIAARLSTPGVDVVTYVPTAPVR